MLKLDARIVVGKGMSVTKGERKIESSKAGKIAA